MERDIIEFQIRARERSFLCKKLDSSLNIKNKGGDECH